MNKPIGLSAIILLLVGGAQTALSQINTLTVMPSTVILCGQPGQAISGVPISVSSPSGSVTFLVTSVTSDGNWLTVDPSFATVAADRPVPLLLGLNSSVIPFAKGNYTGQIVLGSLTGARLATIPVSLQVSAAGCGSMKSGSLFANSGPLTFQLPTGVVSNGNTQVLSVYNTYRTNVLVAPRASTGTGQKWLSTANTNLSIVTGILYPTPLGIGISTEGLSAGTYTGNIELNASNGATLNIPVMLIVSASAGSARFAITPSPLGVAKQ